MPAVAPVTPRAISEILEPHAAPPRARDRAGSAARSPARAGHTAERARGFAVGAHRGFRKRHQRNSGGTPRTAVSTSSFIAAARRAAQAAAAAPANDKPAAARPSGPPATRPRAKEPSTITSKIRSLLVGASVVVIVLGTFKMAMTLLDSGSAPPMPAMENSSEPPAAGATARR